MGLFSTPHARLAWRAVLAGATSFVTFLAAADNPWDSGLWKAAAVTAGWAFVEAFTPLNALVGWWKKPV
jgi:hypothetical protein